MIHRPNIHHLQVIQQLLVQGIRIRQIDLSFIQSILASLTKTILSLSFHVNFSIFFQNCKISSSKLPPKRSKIQRRNNSKSRTTSIICAGRSEPICHQKFPICTVQDCTSLRLHSIEWLSFQCRSCRRKHTSSRLCYSNHRNFQAQYSPGNHRSL